MSSEKMREMREAFERTNCRDHRRQPPKGNNYIDPIAQADWVSFQKGWHASREAIVVELCDSPGRYYNGAPVSATADPLQCWRDGYAQARDRIEEQGLMVKP